MSISDRSTPFTSVVLSLLRIVTGFLFIAHGTQKLIGFPPHLFGSHVPYLSLFGAASVIETIGGPLILLGLFTRPVAFILCGEMAVAYFHAHAPRGFWPLLNGGEVTVLYCFLFLYFTFAGGGAWSLDRSWRGTPR